jgi:hypothetical protein
MRFFPLEQFQQSGNSQTVNNLFEIKNNFLFEIVVRRHIMIIKTTDYGVH